MERKIAEKGTDSCDSSIADSFEDFENTSGSSSSEKSTSEDKPETSTASRPSGFMRKKKNSEPRSSGKTTLTASEKQQTKKMRTKKSNNLNENQLEELAT